MESSVDDGQRIDYANARSAPGNAIAFLASTLARIPIWMTNPTLPSLTSIYFDKFLGRPQTANSLFWYSSTVFVGGFQLLFRSTT